MANVFEIKVKIDRESDLYEPLNPEKELNQDITAYMERQIADRNIGEKVLIHIISQESVNEQDVSKAFWDWIHGIEDSFQKQRKTNWVKQAWMFIVGVAFIAAGLFLQSHVNIVVYTVVSTIGAFAMWEAAAIWIVEGPSNKIRKRVLKNITKGVEFQFETIDGL